MVEASSAARRFLRFRAVHVAVLVCALRGARRFGQLPPVLAGLYRKVGAGDFLLGSVGLVFVRCDRAFTTDQIALAQLGANGVSAILAPDYHLEPVSNGRPLTSVLTLLELLHGDTEASALAILDGLRVRTQPTRDHAHVEAAEKHRHGFFLAEVAFYVNSVTDRLAFASIERLARWTGVRRLLSPLGANRTRQAEKRQNQKIHLHLSSFRGL